MRDHFHNKHIDAIDADLIDKYFKPVLLEALEHSGKPRSVCDVGCGNGIFTGWIKDSLRCRLVGVDGSEYALKKAKQLNFDELHHIEDFSNDNLPFKDESFDFVINKDVLEHLLNPENLVHEIARITRMGGFALIHAPNHFTISGRLMPTTVKKRISKQFPDSFAEGFTYLFKK